ncbi:MAG: ribonuclease HII [Candidatus Nanopelagicales bacterium]|nr:ribonuclease HII [Candidatus Nanopelagicales bacterium]
MMRGGATVVAGVDEVGRGAIAGPVSVGVVVVRSDTGTAPVGLKDSKLLSPAAREALAPEVRGWAAGHCVGHASAGEIDEYGIMSALRLAALRALANLPEVGAIILDGTHDWLSGSSELLFDPVPWPDVELAAVTTVVRGDQRCSSVAAASVIAKTTRDTIMCELAGQWPVYRWQENKGYAAPAQLAAMRSDGLCPQHRRSWALQGMLSK